MYCTFLTVSCDCHSTLITRRWFFWTSPWPDLHLVPGFAEEQTKRRQMLHQALVFAQLSPERLHVSPPRGSYLQPLPEKQPLKAASRPIGRRLKPTGEKRRRRRRSSDRGLSALSFSPHRTSGQLYTTHGSEAPQSRGCTAAAAC